MGKICPVCGTENTDTAKFCKQDATPLRSSASRCPNGHIIAPGQTKCPICEADKQKTLIEDPDAPAQPKIQMPPMTPPPAGGSGARSSGSAPRPGNVGGVSRSSTMVLTPPQPGVNAPDAALERKIVGVLLTYSTRPDGQIFPVREGRNRIGRNSENEISVPDDTAMSGINTFIIFHPQAMRQFLIDDANSQNGTFVNGEMVLQREPVQNYSEIRAGSTVFTFIAAKSVLSEADGTAPEDSSKEGSHGTDLSHM